MIRDITLGQYYPADSVIHKLDPRVKLAGTMVFIISLFAFRSVSAYVVATLALGSGDPYFKGAAEIYDARSEVDPDSAD